MKCLSFIYSGNDIEMVVDVGVVRAVGDIALDLIITLVYGGCRCVVILVGAGGRLGHGSLVNDNRAVRVHDTHVNTGGIDKGFVRWRNRIFRAKIKRIRLFDRP